MRYFTSYLKKLYYYVTRVTYIYAFMHTCNALPPTLRVSAEGVEGVRGSAVKLIVCDSHAHLVSKPSSVIGGKSIGGSSQKIRIW